MWLGLLIVAATLAVYWPVFGFDFVSYDDPDYVVDNPHVHAGLTVENVTWAFTESHASNWHPLTWLSHQLDCSLFGLDPGPPHALNLALHLANVLLLLGLLRALGLSVLAATWISALFALHPLHVESVAWISERKDVLSTLFGLLALRAYVAYTRSRTLRRYLAVTGALVLGLLAKPMLVTFPILFLLLDHWPLGRLQPLRRALVEKLPWFLIALACAAITVLVQEGARSDLTSLGLPDRLRTAVVGLGRYMIKLLWPVDTAVLYPHRYMHGATPYSQLQVLASAALVAVATGASLAFRRRGWPVLGWFWFLVVMAPVIGVIQVGSQAIADRYTYVSYVGLWILLAQVGGALSARGAAARRTTIALGALSVVACAGLSQRAVGNWRNSETLFRHTLEVAPDNPIALYKLAKICDEAQDFDAAEGYYRAALEHSPSMAIAHVGLAVTLNRSGRSALAIPVFERALEFDPSSAAAHTNLGLLFAIRGQSARGMQHLERAFELRPEGATVLRNLGLGYQINGDLDRAFEFLERALEAGDDAVAAEALEAVRRQGGRRR
ncbi:MAG: Flp pilus assembly protein TadD [Chlamydiales bacterium]|jgi:Flp pilus assembly protein TadD